MSKQHLHVGLLDVHVCGSDVCVVNIRTKNSWCHFCGLLELRVVEQVATLVPSLEDNVTKCELRINQSTGDQSRCARVGEDGQNM